MNKVFIDTNVLIDFLGERHPFYSSAAKIVSLADRNEIELLVSSLSYATASYVLMRYNQRLLVLEKMKKFSTLCTITNVGGLTVERALYSDFVDFEDALQYYSALESGADVLITRNIKDFKASEIPMFLPDEYLKMC